MPPRYPAVCGFIAATLPCLVHAETNVPKPATVHLELNTMQDTEGACRLSFVADNRLDTDIEKAVFETVIFDGSNGVVTLSLFDFQNLPKGRPRVRQFDVAGIACGSIGRVLINGANTCTANGTASDMCDSALSTSSRIDVELLG